MNKLTAKKIILFGIGEIGENALNIFGKENVYCFIDNFKSGCNFCEMPVYSFNKLLKIHKSFDVVITVGASSLHEVESQCNKHGISYVYFNDYDLSNMPIGDIEIKKKPTGKKIILFGLGESAKEALRYFSRHIIYCFIDDNNKNNFFHGVPIYSFDDLLQIHENYDIILSADENELLRIKMKCEDNDISYIYLDDIIFKENYPLKCFPNNQIFQQFNKKHDGERCFLVGNGPSLSHTDLTTLYNNNEISFGCNAISKIFDKTPWRPKYFATQDRVFFKSFSSMLANTEAEYKFFPDLDDFHYEFEMDTKKIINELSQGLGKTFYIREIPHYSYHPLGFSNDASKALYLFATVMYMMIQLAAYMGFKEIYLIGVDGGTVSPINNSNYISEKHHFYEENDEWIQQFQLNQRFRSSEWVAKRVTKAYKKANNYTKRNNIKIFNATRGGTIEVFERVDFDSLF